jgi:3D (Asp-Asp-Asp) domain-containing protein
MEKDRHARQALRQRRFALISIVVAAVAALALALYTAAATKTAAPSQTVTLMKIEPLTQPPAPAQPLTTTDPLAVVPSIAVTPSPAITPPDQAPSPSSIAPAPQLQQQSQHAAAPTFDGRPLRKVREMNMLVTAYSPGEQSCGPFADGITASGYSVWTNGMKLVAADTRLLPFRSIISIPGYNGGRPVPVLDRGGKIKGHRLDVLYPTHEAALQWGKQKLTVTVWEYAD